jgi:hypothetical protein
MEQMQDIYGPPNGCRNQAIIFKPVTEIAVLETVSEAVVETVHGQRILPVTG